MVLVVRYRVTIDLLFLSSPNPQPIQFLIFSSPPPPRYPLVKEFLSSFVFKSLSMESVFPQSSLSLSHLFSISFLLLCFCHLPLSYSFPSFIPFCPPFRLGFLPLSRCFLIHPPFSLSLPLVSLHLSLSTVLSFSCGLLGSHALHLYLCLWEKRRPSASN